jgi:hypothetical protein
MMCGNKILPKDWADAPTFLTHRIPPPSVKIQILMLKTLATLAKLIKLKHPIKMDGMTPTVRTLWLMVTALTQLVRMRWTQQR